MVLSTRKKLGIMYGNRYYRDTVMIILPHIQISNHLHCMPETNTLYVSYTSKQKKMRKHKNRRSCKSKD